MGLLVFKKKYSLVKYACVIMVAAGIALFMVQIFNFMLFIDNEQMPSGGGHHKSTVQTTSFGIVLLVASLVFDGLTGTPLSLLIILTISRPLPG